MPSLGMGSRSRSGECRDQAHPNAPLDLVVDHRDIGELAARMKLMCHSSVTDLAVDQQVAREPHVRERMGSACASDQLDRSLGCVTKQDQGSRHQQA